MAVRILCKNTIKTTIQHESRCVQAVIRFAGLESGLVLDIYCLMPYANTEQNWVVFATEGFRNRLSESEKWLNALLFL